MNDEKRTKTLKHNVRARVTECESSCVHVSLNAITSFKFNFKHVHFVVYQQSISSDIVDYFLVDFENFFLSHAAAEKNKMAKRNIICRKLLLGYCKNVK